MQIPSEKQLQYLSVSAEGGRYLAFYRQELPHRYRGGASIFLNPKIVLVRQGEAVWQIGQKQIHVHPNDLVLLHNNGMRQITDVPTEDGYIMEYVEFSPLSIYPYLRLLSVFFSGPASISNIVPHTPAYEGCLTAFHRLSEEAQNPGPMQNEMIMGHLLTLLAGISRAYAVTEQLQPIPLSQRNYDLICQCIVYLDVHYPEQISQQMMADRLGLSVSHFSRMFTHCIGTPFSSYLRSLRLQKTLHLLRSDPTRNILTAALDCGFGSSAGFYKTVHELTGSTPGALIHESIL